MFEYKPWRNEAIPWRDKAQRLIYFACRDSYTKTQISKATGKRYRFHVPYSVPQLAVDLIDCLNRDDEVKAKTIFNFDYDASKLW